MIYRLNNACLSVCFLYQTRISAMMPTLMHLPACPLTCTDALHATLKSDVSTVRRSKTISYLKNGSL